MSSRDKGDKKSKRRRRDSDDDVVRGSGVDYSKVADRHVDDERFEKHKQQGVATVGVGSASSAPTVVDNQPKVSSQMAAVMRLMAGMEERTIAQKLADSNRPTWEQYKKDNEDKLDLVGADMKKMEAYRKELDEQREKLLTRGTNHKSNDNGGDKKSKKKHGRKKHSRRYDDSYSSDSSDSSDDYGSNDDSRRDRKRKKHRKNSKSSKHDRKKSSRRDKVSSDSYDSDEEDRKKSSKHSKREKKKKKKSRDGDSDSVGDDKDKYRLSSFFANGSDDESR
jgi:hypothetical protein